MKNSFTILVALISILFSGLLKSQTVEFTIPDKILHLTAEDSSANFGLPLMWGAFQVKTILACKVNNDAYEDLIVYAPGGKNLDGEKIGKVYIYFGSANGVSTSPSQIIDGLRVINDVDPYGQLMVGDFNNDGNNDLVVGYESYNRQSNFTQGYAICFFGKTDGSGIDPAQKLIIEAQSNHGGFTHTMEKGDFNHDGIDDLLIGALHDGGYYEGRIYCYYGGSSFDATPDVTFSRNGGTVLSCNAIKIADVNNDNFDDIITSDIPSWNPCAVTIDVFMGDNNMNTQPAYVQGLDGMLCLQVGDINGDGYEDIMGTNGNGLNCDGTAPYHFITVITGSADYSLGTPLLIPFEGQVAIPSNLTNSIDVNNDGINDVFLTITKDDGTKESYIFAGHPTQYINLTDTLYKFVDTDNSYGNTIENIIPADCNGDGKPEFYGYSQMAPYKGVIFVYENLITKPDYSSLEIFTTGLNVPNQIVFDNAGNLFVANHTYASYSGPYSNTIAKIDETGEKSVFLSGFTWPSGIAIDKQDNIFFTQNNASYNITKVTPQGNATTFVNLNHRPGPITVFDNFDPDSFAVFTVSHWNPYGIIKTSVNGSHVSFNQGRYLGCEISNDGKFLFVTDHFNNKILRFNTVDGTSEDWVTFLRGFETWPSTIGPDYKPYFIARSISDTTKDAVFRINGFNDVTEIITKLPVESEFNDLAFKKNGGNYDLYMSEVVNSERSNPEANRIIRFSVVPIENIEKILFSAKPTNEDFYSIYSMNVDGTNRVQLFSDNYHRRCPIISKDHSEIFYLKSLENEATGDSTWICKSNLDGTNEQILWTNLTPTSFGLRTNFDVSPDNQKLIYAVYSEPGRDGDIFEYDFQTQITVNLTNDWDYLEDDPIYSPDATKIVYTKNGTGWFAWPFPMYLMNADGSNNSLFQPIESGGYCRPSFSHDGSKLLFCYTSQLGTTHSLFSSNSDGSDVHQIIPSSGSSNNIYEPTFNHDATKLAFSRDNYSQLLITDLTGNILQQIDNTGINGFYEIEWGMVVNNIGNQSLPNVSTIVASDITTNTATTGGEVTADGGTAVTSRGVCWNTIGNPNLTDSLTTDGSGTGTFISQLTGLIPGTTYYVRAYATNSVGTAYGDQLSFTTLPQEVLSLSIPDTLKIPYGGISLAPVVLTNPDNIAIEAFDLIITYNPAVISISGITLTGGVLDGLNYVSQVNAGVPGQITIILYAGGNLFSGEGEIFYLSLSSLSNIGDCSSLNFSLADINEESVSTTAGQVCIIQTLFDVTGNVAYFGNSNPVRDVLLTLTGDGNYSATTNPEGMYQYSSVLRGNYISKPSKTNDLGGLSGTDASRIARYSAGLFTLNCMEQIAADVSLNGSISGVDASRVARYSAGIITELNPEIKNWVFTPESITSCPTWPPIGWIDNRTYNDINADLTGQDFTAIRLGDVTGNWMPDSKFKNEVLNQDERKAVYNSSADSIHLLIHLDEALSIEGVDISLEYDASKLKFVKADFESSIFEGSDYEMQVKEGAGSKLKMVIYALGDLYYGDGVLTKITFAVTSETNKPARVALTSLSINENRVKGWLALQNEPSGHQFKTEVLSIFGDAESSFLAVFPNPFQNKTCISYYLKEQSKVTVQITDINGKLVKTIANEVQNEGINELSWNGDNDQKQQLPQGVYFAVFKSENIMEVKRVVLIR